MLNEYVRYHFLPGLERKNTRVPAHASHPVPPRLAVGLVGSGRVGPVLARALRRAGHRLLAATPGRAAATLGEVALRPADEVAVRVARGLLLLAVPDDVLPGLAAGLAATGCCAPGTLVAHTSGRHALAVLEPLRAVGALPLALHPAMTFPGGPADLDRLAGASFGVTTPDPLRPVGEMLVLEMGGEPVWIPESARALYHAALTHGSNHLVALVAQAGGLLADAGVAEPMRLLGPLLGSTLENVLRSGPAALTGPVVRGDAGTVAAHLEVLAGHPALPAYRVLARAAADLALGADRLDATAAASLLGILADNKGLD